MTTTVLFLLLTLSTPTRTATTVVEVNTASTEALTSLPGIGPVIAGRIVEARARRPFRSAADLARRVRGVGPRMIERLRDRIEVRAPRAEPPPLRRPTERAPRTPRRRALAQGPTKTASVAPSTAR